MNSNALSNIALIGNPNCGKSTLFNQLTGLKQRTSNLPGTTVEIFSGQWKTAGRQYKLFDFPGSYSLCSKNNEEARVVKVLMGESNKPRPDAVIYVLSAQSLRRGLLLFQQVADIDFPMVVALTMSDTAQRKNLFIDTQKLSALLNVPVVILNPRTGEGVEQLSLALEQVSKSSFTGSSKTFYQDLKAFVEGAEVREMHKKNLERYVSIEEVVKQVLTRKTSNRKSVTSRFDRWATHPIVGFLIFALVMLTIFQGIFTLAEYPMQWIETGFGWLSESLQNVLPESLLSNLLTKGLIPGIMGVVTFLPQIAILFFFIGLLEDSGYMARASFLTDSVMRKIGLNGRSLIPLVGGFACAIPSIMACRTIKNPVERMATMFVIPLMSCSARLPVYLLLVSLIVPRNEYLFNVRLGSTTYGVLQWQALWMTGIYFAGILMAALFALALKMLRKKGSHTEFLLELPTYQVPHTKAIFKQVLLRCKSFLSEAGKIIVVLSIILWFLSAYGPGTRMEEAGRQARSVALKHQLSKEETQGLVAEYKLQNSYIGIFGQWIEPVLKPMGFDWKTGIAIASSFAAREVFVGTMNTLFATNAEGDEVSALRQKMAQVKDPVTGRQRYSKKYAISLLFFFAFALQCMSTIAVMKRESGGWKWPVIQLLSFTTVAVLFSIIINNLL